MDWDRTHDNSARVRWSSEQLVTSPGGHPLPAMGTMGRVTVPQRSFYDEVGGHDTFHAIVSRFYQLVREDEILLPLYPPDELDAAEERLRMFLEQYWGGPRTYSDRRGPPRRRMIAPPPRTDWGCSSSNIGGARGLIPIGVAIPACGCATPHSESGTSSAMPGCVACTPRSQRSTPRRSTTSTAKSCSPIW